MDNREEGLIMPDPLPLQTSLNQLTQESHLKRHNTRPGAYVDVFVDDFLVMPQGPTRRRHHIRSTLFHSLEKVLRPLHSVRISDRK